MSNTPAPGLDAWHAAHGDHDDEWRAQYLRGLIAGLERQQPLDPGRLSMLEQHRADLIDVEAQLAEAAKLPDLPVTGTPKHIKER